ncbi:Acyl-CoA carboxylase epsilon subunit [Saccharopolyspora antimicrobica]|uniref:Acyl-CoA carboxylase epsilon subunit n=1 Tax=Saccharopolyspora antimicrobica TaxID=455193 RepID=A0A1I4S373_9PSEU|nr:acyl-CoA carboxylase epsilon subunit [Saccharopolyspora antimicrobica]RKT87563.1 acyl-CoA carboxylase epsilon subunit-like protein [Saccharopolyspora antimicrobica]SFM58851.1 Acyl-CoA carboxylase epsilon subunit [Saccharopolyspora antimicrobica]
MSHDADAVPERPVLRIVRGDPDEVELAALTAALTGLAAAKAASAEPQPEPMSRWGDPAAAVRHPAGRRPLRPGPHAWRASALPG